MDKLPLISIIIPTFNRAHLIGETLDSIIAQTYTNWECIVVDDGSTDNTSVIAKEYLARDNRFLYYDRPANHKPGGNGARNYGLERSRGEYIQWFDSDDLMVPHMIALKVEELLNHQVDFVISKTKYFNAENITFENYNFKTKDVNFLTYATGSINWFTPDLMIRRKMVSGLSFNEDLKAGQEYNFNCKLLLVSTKMELVDDFLTLRRAHSGSLGHKRRTDMQKYFKTKFDQHWLTFTDVNKITTIPEYNQYALLKCIKCYYKSKNAITLPNHFKKALKKTFGSKYYFFTLGAITNKLFRKYLYFYILLKN